MIRLIDIELKKIFRKKMIYIYFGLLFALTFGISLIDYFVSKNASNIINMVIDFDESYYDLKDPESVQIYVSDKSFSEMSKIAADYKVDSPENYFINEYIQPALYEYYEAKYYLKDETKMVEAEQYVNSLKEMLDDFNWKDVVQLERDSVNEEIANLDESSNEYKVNQLKLEMLDYRIKNNIPLAQNYKSSVLNDYVISYQGYLDEQDRNKLQSKIVNDNKYYGEEDSALKSYTIYKYMVENNKLDSNDPFSTQSTVISSFSFDLFIFLFLLIVGGSIISEEFNKGTIKSLLLKPYSRYKIFFSKVIAVLITFIAFLFAYALMNALVYGIFNGDFNTLFEPVLYYNYKTGGVIEHNLFMACFEAFIVTLPELLMLFGLSILVSVLFTNTSIAIIIPIGANIASDIINSLATGKWTAYLPTKCWDLSEFMHGGHSFVPYYTLSKSIIVDVVTIILIFGISAYIFKKKQIKNQ